MDTTLDLALDGAGCTLWPQGPLWNGAPAATIGQFRAESAEAGAELLALACDRLRELGCKAVLAPMNGDTWHSYRVVLESDGSPPFALEPVSGPHDLAALRMARFAVLEEYVSARAEVPAVGSPPPDIPGIVVTSWDGTGASRLVGQLHAYAAGSFSDKLFFKPLNEQGFRALYEPLLAMLDPRLVLFAHDIDGRLVGFLFGLPDLAQGERPTQVILKTYAATRAGAGYLLAWHFHERARELGYTHVVHALMHSANTSRKSSRRFAGVDFRRYAVLGKLLAP